jgi:dTDP-glucose 4,6-dehydratase
MANPETKNMTVLVTGGCGFIGSHFVNGLYAKHPCATIINIDAMYYCASEENVSAEVRASDRYTFVHGNICSSDLVTYLLKEHQVTHVVHFAAQSHVQNSFDDSLQFTRDNVMGTHSLLQCAKDYGKLIRFIHCSTDEVYGESMLDADAAKKNEHSILCPTNPYAATKAAAELLATSYNHSFKLPVIVTRGNNVYGPGQYPEKLIPLFIKQLREDKPVTVQGDGSSTRAFMHVSDTVAAFLCVLDRGVVGDIYNIGCDEGSEHTVMEVANTLIRKLKGKTTQAEVDEYITYVADRPFNDKRYYISNQKLRDIGWEMKTVFKDGIEALCQLD